MFILLPLACSLYALSAILLVSLLLHLSPIPLKQLASAYSLLSIISTALFVRGAIHVSQLFQYIPLSSTAYSSTCIQLSSFHQLSNIIQFSSFHQLTNIILIPNAIVIFHPIFFKEHLYSASWGCSICYICLRFPYKIFFFLYCLTLAKPADRWGSFIFHKFS